MPKVGTRFLKSSTNEYGLSWYQNRRYVYMLTNMKGLSSVRMDDMITLYNIGRRFVNSEDHEIKMFGYNMMETANDHISWLVRHDKDMLEKVKIEARCERRRG